MVINQSLAGAVSEALSSGKAGKVIGARHGIKGILKEDFFIFNGISGERLEAIASTPSSALGSVRMKPSKEDCRGIFDVLRKNNVKWFFYIGGNDSAETASIISDTAKESGEQLMCFHIPKTIDNDLRENDHTPGFGSAARFVASAFIGDDLDSRALGGVKINVVMGRHAGFLTAASALARQCPGDGPHLIYLPERPFHRDRFVKDVMDAVSKYGRCVVAVSEGICDENGRLIAESFTSERDSHGNMQLSGSGALGDALAAMLKEKSNGAISRVRADTFGYLQRSFPGIASETDSREAREVGKEAVRIALSGCIQSASIAIKRKPAPEYGVFCEAVPLSSVAKNTRHMPDEFISESGNDVTKAFLDYAAPLVGELPRKGLIEGV